MQGRAASRKAEITIPRKRADVIALMTFRTLFAVFTVLAVVAGYQAGRLI